MSCIFIYLLLCTWVLDIASWETGNLNLRPWDECGFHSDLNRQSITKAQRMHRKEGMREGVGLIKYGTDHTFAMEPNSATFVRHLAITSLWYFNGVTIKALMAADGNK